MRRRKNREINVFNTSAIDLFASAMGVFILLMIITIPYYTKTDHSPQIPVVDKEEYDRLADQIADLNREMASIQREKNALDEVILGLRNQLSEALSVKVEEPQTQPQRDIVPSLQARIRELELEIEAQKNKQQNLVEAEEKTAGLIDRVKKLESELEEQTKTIQVQIESIQRKDEEVRRIREELERVKATNRASFVVVIVKWTTEKHDLDLEVIDPDGARYNFRTKEHAGRSGLFSLDSRTGPGAEIFQSAEALVGEYRVIYEFYNSYGNDEPLEAQGTILTSKGSFDLPAVTMDLQSNRRKEFRFQLRDEGEVVILQ